VIPTLLCYILSGSAGTLSSRLIRSVIEEPPAVASAVGSEFSARVSPQPSKSAAVCNGGARHGAAKLEMRSMPVS